MSIIDRVKYYFNRKKTLRLEAGDLSRTAAIIKIDSIESIINDKEMYQKFLDYEKNEDFFGKGIQIDYLSSIKDYADFMRDKGVRFDREQNKRIKKIEKMLPKILRQKAKENEQKQQKVSYGKASKAKLYEVSQLILNDEKEFDLFITSKDENFHGLPINEINRFIGSEMSKLYKRFDYSDYKQQGERLDFIREKDELTKIGYQMSPDIKLNQDFENSIMRDIEKDLSPEEFAFSLYTSLNSKVRYDTSFFALDQDLSNEFARAIHQKPIDQITEKDNKVICKSWAELYAYLLQKNGYTAYVKGGGHRWVEAIVGGSLVKADATNPSMSKDDKSRMTDLVRAKIGARPGGFELKSMKDLKPEDFEAWKNLSNMETYYRNIDNPEVSELIGLIDEKSDLSAQVLGYDGANPLKGIVTKLNFINKLLSDSKLQDNQESASYLLHLYNHVLNKEDKKRAVLKIGALYRNIYKDCEMVPIISLYTGDLDIPFDSRDENDYRFLTYAKDKLQLSKISREGILRMVANGEIARGVRDQGKFDKIGLRELNMMQEQLKQYVDVVFGKEDVTNDKTESKEEIGERD